MYTVHIVNDCDQKDFEVLSWRYSLIYNNSVHKENFQQA